jgi:hypothetical protein
VYVGRSSTSYRKDLTIWKNVPDPCAPVISDEYITLVVDSNAIWIAQLGSRGWTAITAVARSTCTGKGEDCAVRQHLSNAMVMCICNEYITSVVSNNAIRLVQLGSRGWTAITAVIRITRTSGIVWIDETRITTTGQREDSAIQKNFPDAAATSNKYIAELVHTNAERCTQLGSCGWTAISAIAGCTSTSESNDCPI